MKDKSLNRIQDGAVFHRDAQTTVSNIDPERRTVQLSFASEAPVQRYDYTEILSMSREAADLSRLNSGGALLSDHASDRQIGVIEKAWIGDDKRGHAIVRFSKRQAAQDEFQDVIDEIRTNVSFGYRIREHKIERGEPGALDTVTATRWEAFEISLVSIPADKTVGTVREADETPGDELLGADQPVEEVREVEAENTRGSNMKDANGNEIVAPAIVTPTFTREAEIQAFGRQFGADERVVNRVALDPNGTVESLRSILADQYKGAELPATPEAPITEIGLTDKETRQYSIARAVLAQADGNWKGAEFERECHETIATKLNRQTGGFYVPSEVQLHKRDLSVGGGVTTGGALVGTDHMPQSFIDILRSKMKMLQLGVQVMGGLVGNPSIPRQDGAATGYWVAEGQAPTESQQVFAQLGLNPKTCGAVTEFTRQLLLQSAPSIDMLVMSDIAAVLARTVDKAIIQGSGAAGQPTGILSTTGVTETSMAGASFAWADAVNFESVIAEADAPDAVAFLARPGVKGTLKTRAKIGSTYPVYLIGEDGKLNGYNFETTTQMPADTLIFGDFSTVILGEWGILEIEANRLGSGFRAGNIEVRGLQSVDVAVRYPQALRKLTAFA
jgi:HK97 family phage major capsid protein